MKVTTLTKRRQSDDRAATQVKLLSLVTFINRRPTDSKNLEGKSKHSILVMSVGDFGGVLGRGTAERKLFENLGDP